MAIAIGSDTDGVLLVVIPPRLLEGRPDERGEQGMRPMGRDFSSGWNCTPTNQGWPGSSTISGRRPSGDMPEKRSPACSSTGL